jgi:hypothetical protein
MQLLLRPLLGSGPHHCCARLSCRCAVVRTTTDGARIYHSLDCLATRHGTQPAISSRSRAHVVAHQATWHASGCRWRPVADALPQLSPEEALMIKVLPVINQGAVLALAPPGRPTRHQGIREPSPKQPLAWWRL